MSDGIELEPEFDCVEEPFLCARCGSTDDSEVLDMLAMGAPILNFYFIQLGHRPEHFALCVPCIQVVVKCLRLDGPQAPGTRTARPIPGSLINPGSN